MRLVTKRETICCIFKRLAHQDLLTCISRGFVIDFNRFLNSQNLDLCQRKPKTNSPFFLTIAILEHWNC